MFSQERQKARRQYKDFVRGEDSGEVTDFFSKKNLASFFGSQNFVDWVKATYHQLKSNKEIPQSRLLAPTITEIKEIVCQCYEVEEQSLEESINVVRRTHLVTWLCILPGKNAACVWRRSAGSSGLRNTAR
jgi:hypothetical protein